MQEKLEKDITPSLENPCIYSLNNQRLICLLKVYFKVSNLLEPSQTNIEYFFIQRNHYKIFSTFMAGKSKDDLIFAVNCFSKFPWFLKKVYLSQEDRPSEHLSKVGGCLGNNPA